MFQLSNPDSVSSHSSCSSSGHKLYFLQLIKPQSDITPPDVFCGPRHFGDRPGKWTVLTLTEHSGPGSLNWSCGSQWMWLITGQLASGTCANTGGGWECMKLKWESVALCSLLLSNCFNDFPTSCFIFISPVLSVYCKGLPASENNQLCMPLNMYICAFVYSIGVHWYFFFSSQWF